VRARYAAEGLVIRGQKSGIRSQFKVAAAGVPSPIYCGFTVEIWA